jgi:cephalosporin hydroxylase
LPNPVEATLSDTLSDYWRRRLRQHHRDTYAGIVLKKFPEDLRTYEHLLWASRPSVVIEIGTLKGGSALWFRDRLRAMASYGRVSSYHVISIDAELDDARANLERVDPAWRETITLIEGDVCDTSLPARVEPHVPAGSECMVVEDTAHEYETTAAALQGFARFVSPGGFFVVEDGCVDVDELRLRDTWPQGVQPAVRDWLASAAGREFTPRRDLELYGISCHPGGFLQRTQADHPKGR